MLTDTGPLVAIINPNEIDHALCLMLLRTLRAPMVTTYPCLTEAAYLLRKAGGWPYLMKLWTLFDTDVLRLHCAPEGELLRVREVMITYRDLPCDFADASLVAAAETLGTQEVFTRDAHFYAYRMAEGAAFVVKP